ncbi:alpha/beta hydrolase [Phenylobacterium hankyongense]|uniref:Alpha/beta hydrolase n=1 Tax=Phenylobacterium hankyongense TaxID=1813876 RepID=A0A328B038_9CAUL|nr:alpha/beta fold hydrolase [Phenylobacterium hankyongense]RAK60752.1 alpha/beta hydrolase [Phenylobacterium hankyongense]
MARRSAGAPGAVLLAIGLLLMVAGVAIAALVQTSGGIRVRDVRWTGADGAPMAALLYVPPNATPKTPAPGVLAVHGYINTRETQDAFAIEFARRGYVVLAMDQRGHGHSGGGATTGGFGGPDGLRYLRALPFVNPNEIGLEGHSMGGWTVLAAAADQPDGYKALVLEGSSTGKPFAAEGTPTWPRNLAVVYSQFDEFAPLMWGVDRARDVGSSRKLQQVFGAPAPVAAGKVYGDLAAGTGRTLYTPFTTHPGDHISPEAVGDSLDWFARTLQGGTPRPAGDQIWPWKEFGTLVALAGFFAALLGLFDLLLRLPAFAGLAAAPEPARERRGPGWWTLFLLTGFVPAVSFFALLLVAPPLITPSAIFPQAITNHLVVWALLNLAIALLLGWLLGRPRARFDNRWGPALGIAVVTVVAGYGALALANSLANVDFRFWVVALRPMSLRQFLAFLAYVVPFTAFVLVAFRGLAGLMVRGDSAWRQYLTAMVALPLGFVVLTGAQYLALFATGRLPLAFEALNAIVSIQFVPLLAILGLIAAFTWRRTNSYVPGGLIGGLFVTWYMVAGTATHFAS